MENSGSRMLSGIFCGIRISNQDPLVKTKILNNWGSKCPNGPSPSDCYHPALTPEPCPHNSSPRVDRKQLSSEGAGELVQRRLLGFSPP